MYEKENFIGNKNIDIYIHIFADEDVTNIHHAYRGMHARAVECREAVV